MDYAAIIKQYERDGNLLSLMKGSPGAETLKDCKEILLEATRYMLDHEEDTTHIFCYGPDSGDETFREELAKFLTKEYGGDSVHSSNLMVTAGATQALHMIATVLFGKDCVAFIEDPTYFGAYRMLQHDLQLKLVPVPCDEDGMDTDVLERLLEELHPKDHEVSAARPFWGMLYTIPVYNNPTGRCYSPDRCRRLVQLARKYDLLLVAEDIYNLVHFGGALQNVNIRIPPVSGTIGAIKLAVRDCAPPPRLLSYDNPFDPDYRGHVISSATFSKILAPGLRLGWVEAPDRILSLLYESNLINSGGSLNHYTSKLVGAIIAMGLQAKHLRFVRRVYKQRNDAACAVMSQHLPEGSTFYKPQGGFFIWVKFPEGTDAFEMMKWMIEKYNIFFLPGVYGSITGKYRNCARLSISAYEESELVDIFKTLCKAASEFIQLNKSAA